MKSSWKTLIHTSIWILINLKTRFHVSEICPLEEKQINPKQTSRKLYIVKTDKLKQDSGGYNLSFSHFSSVGLLLFSTYKVLTIRIINFDNYVSSVLLESLGILVHLNLGIKCTKTLQK